MKNTTIKKSAGKSAKATIHPMPEESVHRNTIMTSYALDEYLDNAPKEDLENLFSKLSDYYANINI